MWMEVFLTRDERILFFHVSLCKLSPLELRLTDSFKMNGLWPQDLPLSAPPLVLELIAVLSA